LWTVNLNNIAYGIRFFVVISLTDRTGIPNGFSKFEDFFGTIGGISCNFWAKIG
jgi:hypothetical protein